MRKPITLTMDEAMVQWIRDLSQRQRSVVVEQMLEFARTYVDHIDVRGHVTFHSKEKETTA